MTATVVTQHACRVCGQICGLLEAAACVRCETLRNTTEREVHARRRQLIDQRAHAFRALLTLDPAHPKALEVVKLIEIMDAQVSAADRLAVYVRRRDEKLPPA